MNPIGPILALLTATGLAAQVPQGHIVFSTFGNAGQRGLFLSHPVHPGTPRAIHGLYGDLAITGVSCVAYRPNDGAIICGERAQVNSSVDVHVIELKGTDVYRDSSFSLGTGGSCCGEIPQLAVLADGRIVVAATDLAAGPLAMYQTTSYGIQGLGIVDTSSGKITPIPISNGASIVDVFNGLAVAPDESAVFVGTYVSSVQGDIYRIPLPGGGAATKVATVPAGLSNICFDLDGSLLVTTLAPNQSLYRVDVSNGQVAQIANQLGTLNGLAVEAATASLLIVSSSGGTPSRSLHRVDGATGNTILLSNPGLATPSGIDLYPNPHRFAPAQHGADTYEWVLAPNPGGLPLVGNSGFSLTLQRSTTTVPTVQLLALSAGRLAQPLQIGQAQIWLDPAKLIAVGSHGASPQIQWALPVPNNTALVGIQLFAQSLHEEVGGRLASSAPLAFTIL